MDKRLTAVSALLAVSGFSAGAISVSEATQIFGSLTALISAFAVAYQTVTGAKAQNALTYSNSELIRAQAEREAAEVKRIQAQVQKQEIENELLKNRKTRK